MRDENDCRDYGRCASCTEARARAGFVTSANTVNLSLRSSSDLTLTQSILFPLTARWRQVRPWWSRSSRRRSPPASRRYVRHFRWPFKHEQWRQVRPWESTRCKFAPCSMRSSRTGKFPQREETWIGASLLASSWLTITSSDLDGAAVSRIICTQLACPEDTAAWSAVCPKSGCGSFLAPLSRTRATISILPSLQAEMRMVSPLRLAKRIAKRVGI